jgi:hypothetical protein
VYSRSGVVDRRRLCRWFRLHGTVCDLQPVNRQRCRSRRAVPGLDSRGLGAAHRHVDDLPADVRNAFISSHRAMQAEVDEFSAFMNAECRASGQG